MHKLTEDLQGHGEKNEGAHYWYCSGPRHCSHHWSGFDPTGFRRGTRLCDCGWQECRRGPGCKRPAPNTPRFRKRGFLNETTALIVAAAGVMFASVALAQ